MNILQKAPWFIWPLIILFLWFAPKYLLSPTMVEGEGRVVKDTRTSGENSQGELQGRSWWTVAFNAPDGTVHQKRVLGFTKTLFSKESGSERVLDLRKKEGAFLKQSDVGRTIAVYYPKNEFDNFDIAISNEQQMPELATNIRWGVGISLLLSLIAVGLKRQMATR